MTHSRIQKQLSEYLDNRLNSREIEKIELHLNSCVECREISSDFRRNNDAIANLRQSNPSGIWEGVQKRILNEKHTKSGKKKSQPERVIFSIVSVTFLIFLFGVSAHIPINLIEKNIRERIVITWVGPEPIIKIVFKPPKKNENTVKLKKVTQKTDLKNTTSKPDRYPHGDRYFLPPVVPPVVVVPPAGTGGNQTGASRTNQRSSMRNVDKPNGKVNRFVSKPETNITSTPPETPNVTKKRIVMINIEPWTNSPYLMKLKNDNKSEYNDPEELRGEPSNLHTNDIIIKELFSAKSKYQGELNNEIFPKDLRPEFKNKSINLSQNVTVTVNLKDIEWLIEDNTQKFIIRKEDDELKIYEIKTK